MRQPDDERRNGAAGPALTEGERLVVRALRQGRALRGANIPRLEDIAEGGHRAVEIIRPGWVTPARARP